LAKTWSTTRFPRGAGPDIGAYEDG